MKFADCSFTVTHVWLLVPQAILKAVPDNWEKRRSAGRFYLFFWMEKSKVATARLLFLTTLFLFGDLCHQHWSPKLFCIEELMTCSHADGCLQLSWFVGLLNTDPSFRLLNMYLDTWDEFQKAAEDIYVASPARVLDDFPLFSLFDTSVNTEFIICILDKIRFLVSPHRRWANLESDGRPIGMNVSNLSAKIQ